MRKTLALYAITTSSLYAHIGDHSLSNHSAFSVDGLLVSLLIIGTVAFGYFFKTRFSSTKN